MVYFKSAINILHGNPFYRWVRGSVPWVAVGVLFVYLFLTSDRFGVLRAFNQMNWLSFFFVLLCYFIFQFIIDCLGIIYTLKQFNLYVPTFKVFAARGITFLFTVVHYSVGQGALPFYLSRTGHLSLWATSSAILFLTLIDFYWVVFLSFLGALGTIGGSTQFLLIVADYILRIDLALFVVLALFICFWRVIVPRADVFFQPIQKILAWFGQNPLCSAFRQASLRTYWQVAMVRISLHLSMIFFSFLALKTFTPDVPSRVFVLVYPLTLFIGTLPITPAGLGTTQIAIVELLRDFATRETLLAFGMMWGLSIVVLKVLLGILFLYKKSFQSESG